LKVIQETLRMYYIKYLRFYYYHLDVTSAVELLNPESAIRSIVSVIEMYSPYIMQLNY